MTDTSYLPACWTDDQRMAGLMSMFKKREVNVDDWEAKMKFWTQLIESSCEALKDPVITLKTLSTRFRRGDRIPAGLQTVLQEMLRRGDVQTTSSFLKGSEGWVSWGVGLAVKPVSWLLGYGTGPDLSAEEFVVPSVIRDQATKLLERHEECGDEDPMSRGVVEYPTLRRVVKDICPSERSLDLALTHLQRTHEISIGITKDGEKIIKFRESRSAGPAAITETDTNLHNLKRAMDKVEKDINKLEETTKRLDQEARLNLRQGNKTKAKQNLRQKLVVLKQIKEKDVAYNNLMGIMQKLAQTREQREVLDAYKVAASAFKQNLDRHGLSPDKVDETMDDISEALEDHEDMAFALSQGPGIRGLADDDEELEQELDDLLKEDIVARPVKEIKLPEVPDAEVPASSKDRLHRLRLELDEAN